MYVMIFLGEVQGFFCASLMSCRIVNIFLSVLIEYLTNVLPSPFWLKYKIFYLYSVMFLFIQSTAFLCKRYFFFNAENLFLILY